MKVVTRYITEDGAEHPTLGAARKRELSIAMYKYGFSPDTTEKIAANWEHVHRLVTEYQKHKDMPE